MEEAPRLEGGGREGKEEDGRLAGAGAAAAAGLAADAVTAGRDLAVEAAAAAIAAAARLGRGCMDGAEAADEEEGR